MQLSVYLLDPWAQLATQDPAALFAPLLDAQANLRRADWTLQASAPVTQLCQHAAVLSNTQPLPASSILAHWLSTPLQPRPAFALLPVSLAMQRDSFSLQAVLTLSEAVYARLTHSLQQHFADDWQLQLDPQQRGWWVLPHQAVHADSPWPNDCLFQSAFAWQPQGAQARLLRNWTNEIQMLLHGLAASEPDWPEALNSLWFATVPAAQPFSLPQSVALSGVGRCWQGIQQTLPGAAQANTTFAAWLAACQSQKTKQALWVADSPDQVDWATLFTWANQTTWLNLGLHQLQLVLPFAEQSVSVTLGPRQRWSYWRRPQSAAQVIARLHAQLPAQRT